MRQDSLAAYVSNVERRKRRRGDLFVPATKAFLDRVAADLPLRRQQNLDILFRNLGSAGLLDTLDVLYDYTALSQQEALLNLVSPQYDATIGGGAPTFVAGSHVVGNGTTDWLDTNFNPVTAVNPKFDDESAHMAQWSLTDLNNAGALSYLMGNANSYIARTAAVAGGITYRANRASSSTHSASAVLPGHVAWNRHTASLFDVLFEGFDVGGGSAAAALTSTNFRILGIGATGFGTNQARFAHFGAAMALTGQRTMRRMFECLAEHSARRVLV